MADDHWFPAGIPGTSGQFLWDVVVDNQSFATSTVILEGEALVRSLRVDAGDKVRVLEAGVLRFDRFEHRGTLEYFGNVGPPLLLPGSEVRNYLISAGTFQAFGKLVLGGPGRLRISPFDPFDGPIEIAQAEGASIEASGEDATIFLRPSLIEGGTIRVADGAIIDVGTGYYSDVTFVAETGGRFELLESPAEVVLDNIRIAPGTTLRTGGDVVLRGALAWEGTLDLSPETLFIDGGGAGETVLERGALVQDGGFSTIDIAGASSFVVGVFAEIRGSFGLGDGSLPIRNRGLLTTEDGLVILKPGVGEGSLVNEGRVVVTGSGTLFVRAGEWVQQGSVEAYDIATVELPSYGEETLTLRSPSAEQPGKLVAADQSILVLTGGARVVDHILQPEQDGLILVDGEARLQGVTILGADGDGRVEIDTGLPGPFPTLASSFISPGGLVRVNASRRLNVEGTLEIAGGRLELADLGQVILQDKASIRGSGVVGLEGRSRIRPATVGAPLVIGPSGARIEGSGTIQDFRLEIAGDLVPKGGTLTLFPAPDEAGFPAIRHSATTRVGMGATLLVSGYTFENLGSVLAEAGGKARFEDRAGGNYVTVRHGPSGTVGATGIGSSLESRGAFFVLGEVSIEEGATASLVSSTLDRVTLDLFGEGSAATLSDVYLFGGTVNVGDDSELVVESSELAGTFVGATSNPGRARVELRGVVADPDFQAPLIMAGEGGLVTVGTGTSRGLFLGNDDADGEVRLDGGTLVESTVLLGPGMTTVGGTRLEDVFFAPDPDLPAGAPIPVAEMTTPNLFVTWQDVGLAEGTKVRLGPGSVVRPTGTLRVDGLLEADGGAGVSSGLLAFDGLVIAGTGELRFRGVSSFLWGTEAIAITIEEGVTVSGGPALGLPAPSGMDVTNRGTVLLDDLASGAALYPATRFRNEGTFRQAPSRSTPCFGDFENAGLVEVPAGAEFRVTGEYRQESGTTLVGGALKVPGGARFTGGALAGSGSVADSDGGDALVFGGALVSPGAGSRATLTLSGATSFSSATRLRFELGGTSPAESDRVVVSGDADLGGATIEIELSGGFLPAREDVFVLVQGLAAMVGDVGHLGRVATAGGEGTFELAKDGSSLVARAFEVTAAGFVDSDRDGLDDAWERASFGDVARGALEDGDGDGVPALLEFLLGLDPTRPDVTGLAVRVETVDGVERLAVSMSRRREIGPSQVVLQQGSTPGGLDDASEEFLLVSTEPEGDFDRVTWRHRLPLAELPATLLTRLVVRLPVADQ